MGFLLREALRTLCSENQWSYAVFWKTGCQNNKLLIWEECHFETSQCFIPPSSSGKENSELPFGGWEGSWVSSEIRSSQHVIQTGDRVHALLKKVMNNQVNVVGEGIVGRAAFTGTHQWILAKHCIRDSYPPEVLNEVDLQFSAGMQTIAVIPVLPHGVLQLGSVLAIMENLGFVKDVRSLILQLGCVPGALLSDNYATEAATDKTGLPVSTGMPVSVGSSGNLHVTKSTALLSQSFKQQSTLSEANKLVCQPFHSLVSQVQHNPPTAASTFQNQTPNLTQASDGYFDLRSTSVIRPNLSSRGQLENGVVAAEVIPANSNTWLNQQTSAYNSNPEFNHRPAVDRPGASHSSSKLMQHQGLSNAGIQDHINKSINASNIFTASEMSSKDVPMFNSQKGSFNTHLTEGRESYRGSRPFGPISAPYSLLNIQNNTCCTNLDSIGHSRVGSFKAEEVPLSSLVDQLTSSHNMLSGGSDPRQHISSDVKHTQNESGLKKEGRGTGSLHVAHPSEQMSLNKRTSNFVHDCQIRNNGSPSPMSANVKYEVATMHTPAGDDLFDIFGADLKNKLLHGNWNILFAEQPNAKMEDLGRNSSTFMTQDMSSDICSVTEGLSDNDIFFRESNDNLLDAVVSMAHSASMQNSDDNLSCKTSLTKMGDSSIPSSSSTYGQFGMLDQLKRDLLGLPRSLEKAGTAASSSFRSTCSKDDAGSCSQTTSIYTSQISSWVEQGRNIKRDNSVSTGYSKRNDETSRSNRKRLKPGENPRPRPKDRQMIQDRVKELREIVPNGAKCSIDALLERTIKHMLFLQSVTKHADKLKQTGESKIISKEGGLLLKDNFEGGATWAFEVGSQSVVCPVIVEDLNPPRQMLVEMLCEERGFFLEIADVIRGMGLIILQGVMEAKSDKIWARFAVEANRDVTRMEIFMSLVRLLEQTMKGASLSANMLETNNMMIHQSFPQAASIPATGRPGCLQ